MGRTHFGTTKDQIHFTRKTQGSNPTTTHKGHDLEIRNTSGKFSLLIDGIPFRETTSNRGHLISLYLDSLKIKTPKIKTPIETT